MVVLLPYGTDAPVYYWPYATIGTIIICSVIHLITFPLMMSVDEQSAVGQAILFLILEFDKINPLQWLTWNYMHGNPLHLIGNMVALWAFGLIVEGKIGWWKFLIVYNAIGIFEGAFVQLVGYIFIGESGALGASGAIYGLMAISLIWAPLNQMQLFYWLFRWFGTVEGSVLTVAAFFIGLQLVVQGIMFMHALNGDLGGEAAIITSEVLHLVGAAGGLFVGIGMVTYKLVDCEDFDVFSILAGKHKRTKEQKQEDFAKSKEGQALRAQQLAQAQQEFQQHLADGKPLGALATHRHAKNQFPEWSVSEPDFVKLIAALNKLHLYPQSVPAMLEYLKTYKDRVVLIRLALAQVLTDHMQRPRQALTVLAKVNGTALDAKQQQALESIHAKATAAARADPYEVQAEDW